uniref:Uncharacterized protein n=1 Tax=Solanum lycopersicum TaxID=4081 RepID=A0A3Q7EW02_SOLLC
MKRLLFRKYNVGGHLSLFRAPSGRLARRAISSVVERAPDNCVVVPGLSMCSSAPDPEMWIIQGTLAWRTLPVRTGEDRWGDSGEIQCRSNFRFTRGIRAVRGGPPRLLSSRESIHPLLRISCLQGSVQVGERITSQASHLEHRGIQSPSFRALRTDFGFAP